MEQEAQSEKLAWQCPQRTRKQASHYASLILIPAVYASTNIGIWFEVERVRGPSKKCNHFFIFASKLYFYLNEHCACVHEGAITFYQLTLFSTCRQRYKCWLMLHPHCHGGILELTSHREFDSFNVGWLDGRTSKLAAPRRRARILDGTPVEDFAISGPLQRLSCRTPPYVFPGGQLKHPAMFTVRRRGEWASTTVTHR